MSWFIEIFNAPARDSMTFLEKIYHILLVSGAMVFLALISAVIGVCILYVVANRNLIIPQSLTLEVMLFLAACCVGEMACIWLLLRIRKL